MAAATVRADYDQLKQVASVFGQNSDSCKQTLQNLKSNIETLRGGDWIGQGANAFYQEMDDTLVPTLTRLINALDTAANNTSQISSIMKEAEDQAANVLKGPGTSGGGSSTPASGGAAGGALGGLSGAGGTSGGASTGGAMSGAGAGSLGSQITQLTQQATQAVSSLSSTPTSALNNAVSQLGNVASQFQGIVPQNYQPDNTGIGPLLSAIGSPNANQVAQQITQPFTGGGGGGAPSGGGFSGGGGGAPSGGGGGGGPSGGGGGGSPNLGQAMQGFSDQALTSLMNNPNLPPNDRMLAMAIETLRRDPNAFGGALQNFVNQALGQGATQQATQAMGGGISALAGAAGVSAGGAPSASTTNAINGLANNFNNIVQGGGGGVPVSTGQAVVNPIGPTGSAAPSAPTPPAAATAIRSLVQQFIQTVSQVLPQH